MAKKNFFSKLATGISKAFGDEWNDPYEKTWHEMGSAFSITGNNYSKREMLEQYRKSLYVFRAVSVIADVATSIEIDLFEVKNARGEIEEVNDHELYTLIHRPNPDQTWDRMMKIIIMHLELAGEGFIYKIRDERGNVVELVPLQTQYVTKVIGEGRIKSIDLVTNTETINIPFEDVVYFNYPSPFNIHDGQSPLLPVSSRVETEKEASEYQSKFFKNNATPNSILHTEQKLTPEQKEYVMQSWASAFRGANNYGKTALLEAGLEYKQLAISQKEMDFIESMRFTREDILIAFGVPKGILLSEDSNNADGQNSMRAFLELKIEPLVKMIVETLNLQLVEVDFGEQYFLKNQNVVPEDRKALREEIKELVDVVITRNESRQMLGLDEVEGGDVLYNSFTNVPLNVSAKKEAEEQKAKKKMAIFRNKQSLLQTLKFKEEVVEKTYKKFKDRKQNGKQTTAKGNTKGKQLVPMFEPAQRDMFFELSLKRMDKQEQNIIEEINAFANTRKNILIARIQDEMNNKALEDDVIDEQEEKDAWEAFLLPIMLAVAMEFGTQANNLLSDGVFALSPAIVFDLEAHALDTAGFVVSTTNQALSEAISAGISAGEGIDAITDRVTNVYEQFPLYRSQTIARTETTYLNGIASIDAYKQNGVEAKEWITAFVNSRDSHIAMDGEIVEIDKPFSDGETYFPPKKDSPYNCQCVVAPALKV